MAARDVLSFLYSLSDTLELTGLRKDLRKNIKTGI